MHLTIAANFVAEGIGESLSYCLNQLAIDNHLHFAPFDQVIQQLLSENGSFDKSDFNVLLIQVERWLPDRNQVLYEHMRRNLYDFILSVNAAVTRATKISFLVIICPHSPSLRNSESICRIESELTSELLSISGVDVVSTHDLDRIYPATDYSAYFDSHADILAQSPYTRECLATLGTLIARRLCLHIIPARKVIVVDCDNTLWDGFCGEEGARHVVLSRKRILLQEFLVKQAAGGRILCLCSKNEESSVLSVFDSHPGMLLRREHLAAWKINWSPKASNLRDLSSELGLDLDSFIFVDDDAFECAAIEKLLPQVLTLHLPGGKEEIENLLHSVWAFDLKDATDDDRQRNLYYRQNAQREKLRTPGLTLQKFLSELQLKVDISPLSLETISRASQLTLRTNQFNLNGIRRSSAELRRVISGGSESICYSVRAQDRFGDYGMVGLMMFNITNQILSVNMFLLSCRALGRGIEQKMLAMLVEEAHQAGTSRISFAFRPTEKNQPIKAFLTQTGALREDGDCFMQLDAPLALL